MLNIKLNDAQKDYLLKVWFLAGTPEEAEELYKHFDTTDLGWIKTQDLTLRESPNDPAGWPTLYMNDREITTINNRFYRDEYSELINL